jgi:hypothetical protein
MERVNVEGTRILIEESGTRRVVHTASCATCGPVAGRAATEADTPELCDLRVPYKRTKIAGERLALEAASRGSDIVVVNPTTPVGPGDRRPTPTGKMVADVVNGRARAYLRASALNIVAVEDVARGHLLAFERGRAGQRYLLGGENLSMREVFTAIAHAVDRRAPGSPCPGRRPTPPPGSPQGCAPNQNCSSSTRCGSHAGRCASTTRSRARSSATPQSRRCRRSGARRALSPARGSRQGSGPRAARPWPPDRRPGFPLPLGPPSRPTPPWRALPGCIGKPRRPRRRRRSQPAGRSRYATTGTRRGRWLPARSPG